MRIRLVAGILTVGSLTALGLHGLGALRLLTRGQDNGWATWAVEICGYSLGVGSALLAGLILIRAANRRYALGLSFFLICLSMFLLEVASRASPWFVGYPPGPSDVLSPWLIFSVVALARFAATFPEPITTADLEAWTGRPAELQPRIRAWLAGVGAAAFPYLFWLFRTDPWVSITGLHVHVFAAYELVVVITFGALSLLTFRDIRVQLFVRSDEQRHQIYWLLQGFAVWVLAMATVTVWWVRSELGAEGSGLGAAAMVEVAAVALLAAMANGLFLRGALDPALVVERTAVYGFLGTLALLSFAGVESLVSESLEGLLGLGGIVGPVTTGVLMAVALTPFRGLIGRRFSAWIRTSESGEEVAAAAKREGAL